MTRSVVRRPRARTIRRTGLGLFLGMAGGWLAGLLRAPRNHGQKP